MKNNEWVESFPAAITVSDAQGIILEMNECSKETFAAEGGGKLIGSNMLDCHPDSARTKLQEMMDTQRANVYTIEKKGVKKLVYQTPWYKNGEYAGFMEMVIPLPSEIPHFLRGQ